MTQQFGTKKGKGGTSSNTAGTEGAVPGKKATKPPCGPRQKGDKC